MAPRRCAAAGAVRSGGDGAGVGARLHATKRAGAGAGAAAGGKGGSEATEGSCQKGCTVAWGRREKESASVHGRGADAEEDARLKSYNPNTECGEQNTTKPNRMKRNQT